MDATAQNGGANAVYCRGSVLWRRGCGFDALPKYQEMKLGDF
jgi:hypothetical protein